MEFRPFYIYAAVSESLGSRLVSVYIGVQGQGAAHKTPEGHAPSVICTGQCYRVGICEKITLNVAYGIQASDRLIMFITDLGIVVYMKAVSQG